MFDILPKWTIGGDNSNNYRLVEYFNVENPDTGLQSVGYEVFVDDTKIGELFGECCFDDFYNDPAWEFEFEPNLSVLPIQKLPFMFPPPSFDRLSGDFRELVVGEFGWCLFCHIEYLSAKNDPQENVRAIL